MNRKNIYLIAAVVGAILPYIFFVSFVSAEGLDIPGFLSGLFANGAAGGFSADLLFSSFVFWLWSFHDARDHGVERWWLIPVLNLTIGLSAALPLYFFLRYDKTRLHLAT